jgi:transcriptional regulator with XRE-family HTH domain
MAEEDDDLTFGVILRKLRENVGLTQSALGSRSGVQRQYINLIEREKSRSPAEDIIHRLAAVLKVDRDWLMLVGGRCPSEYMKAFRRNPQKACKVIRKHLL